MSFSETVYPLSQTELGIFLACQNPTTAYNLPFLLELPDEWDTDHFIEAVKAFFDAHPGIRTRLVQLEDGSIGRIYASGDPVIGMAKLNSLEDLPPE